MIKVCQPVDTSISSTWQCDVSPNELTKGKLVSVGGQGSDHL